MCYSAMWHMPNATERVQAHRFRLGGPRKAYDNQALNYVGETVTDWLGGLI